MTLIARLVPGMFRRNLGDVPPPEHLLELYGYEACPACRRVRRALTELDLDFVHRSCPRGASRNRERVVEHGGELRFPYLVDPNTGAALYESREIVRYLHATYGG